MGAEIGIGLAVISAGATIGKLSAEEEAAEANLSAINTQSKLLQLQYQQKTLQNLEVTDQLLSRQAAQLTTRGVAFSSPSFNAIQRSTVNTAGRKQSNLDTEESLNQQALEIERKNVKSTLHAQLFGEISNFAFNVVGFGEKIPTKSSMPKKLPQVEEI